MREMIERRCRHGAESLAVVDRHVAGHLADRARDAQRVHVLPQQQIEGSEPGLGLVVRRPSRLDQDGLDRLVPGQRLEEIGRPIEEGVVADRDVEGGGKQEDEPREPVGPFAERDA